MEGLLGGCLSVSLQIRTVFPISSEKGLSDRDKREIDFFPAKVTSTTAMIWTNEQAEILILVWNLLIVVSVIQFLMIGSPYDESWEDGLEELIQLSISLSI